PSAFVPLRPPSPTPLPYTTLFRSGPSLDRLRATGDYRRFTRDALAAAPKAEIVYLHHEIVLAADRAGYDMIGAIHDAGRRVDARSEEHTSELQSRENLVCRLLLEK